MKNSTALCSGAVLAGHPSVFSSIHGLSSIMEVELVSVDAGQLRHTVQANLLYVALVHLFKVSRGRRDGIKAIQRG